MASIAHELEESRIAKRAYERQQRKEKRFQEYLANERNTMSFEDDRSHHLRFYLWERDREFLELEGMVIAETEQCEVDRFWGLDYQQECLAREEIKFRKVYEERVWRTHEQMKLMGLVKPGAQRPDLVSIGNLPEDDIDDNNLRRMTVIKKCKAEEVRSKLKYRVPIKHLI